MKNKIPRVSQRLIFLMVGIVAVGGWILFANVSDFSQRKNLRQLSGEMEKMLIMPKGAYRMASYNRYYAKGEGKDAGFIVGIFRYDPSGKGEVLFVPYSSLPRILDGGCNVVRIRYSILDHRIDLTECNGDA